MGCGASVKQQESYEKQSSQETAGTEESDKWVIKVGRVATDSGEQPGRVLAQQTHSIPPDDSPKPKGLFGSRSPFGSPRPGPKLAVSKSPGPKLAVSKSPGGSSVGSKRLM
eukprot:TRINITY_DN6569_c0_g1_i1.p1 TRINITY_DN6569_c0_g1~~TRINITY_DN6569_c0_g1_i1.p1  ORF type:complete len:111 (+),score=16.28 TRINITY_DN6569_c0_g1_i1:158-490(+)